MTAPYPISLENTEANDTIGDLVAHFLAEIGVTTVFGVISIHNMPILDAIGRQGRIRFVPARGEAGAMNMADAYARVSCSLGVVITSTGTAAGNAAGSQVEALTAGTPLLHITSQVDRGFADRDRAPIHDVPRQADMLKAISKATFRVWEPHGLIPTLKAAATAALTAPSGPVSIEIPVDIQRLFAVRPEDITLNIAQINASERELDLLAQKVRNAKRPMLWLGGGARLAGKAATALVERGFCVVTSTQGRAIVSESHPRSLGAFNMTSDAEAIYKRCDLMIAVGTRFRGNETHNNRLALPHPLIQIDADATQGGRNYPVEMFVHGDATASLEGLVARLPQRLDVDPQFGHEVAVARAKSESQLRSQLGPYQILADALLARVAKGGHPFVRDVTIANSTFGNRYVTVAEPRLGVHALGGGIGQGIAMAVGAALAESNAKTVAIVGDGGAMLYLTELLTAVEEELNIVFILMNDNAYGVIKNIQDAQYDSRYVYSALKTPDYGQICAAFDLAHEKIDDIDAFEAVLDKALAAKGPILLEIDMMAIGPFSAAFAGPPAGAAGEAK